MNRDGKTDAVEALVGQMKERINLAISLSADANRPFEDGEAIFREVISALELYRCFDTAAEQLVNFSNVAFFRGEYVKALELAGEAVEKSKSEATAAKARSNLKNMAYGLLEYGINDPETGLLQRLELILEPEDYARALDTTAVKFSGAGEGDDIAAMGSFAKGLSMESVRQGIRQERLGNISGALLLFRHALPFLNPKRRAVIEKEIERLEAEESGK